MDKDKILEEVADFLNERYRERGDGVYVAPQLFALLGKLGFMHPRVKLNELAEQPVGR